MESRLNVIGLPYNEMGSLTLDIRVRLSDAAVAGQTAPAGCASTGPNYCHADLTQASDLSVALANALDQVPKAALLSCDFSITPSPLGLAIDTTMINVIYEKAGDVNDAYLILQADPSCPADVTGAQHGWYLNPSTGYISLCPSSCEMIQQDIGAVIDIRAGCQPVTIPY